MLVNDRFETAEICNDALWNLFSKNKIDFSRFDDNKDEWSSDRKRFFIECLLIDVHFSPLYLIGRRHYYYNQESTQTLKILDGWNRLKTIKDFFVDQSFTTGKFKFLKNLDNLCYKELPPSLRTDLRARSLKFIFCEEILDRYFIEDLYKSLNSI